MNLSAFRVNADMLSSYPGKRVCLVGRVLNQNGQMATVQSANQQVQVQRNPGANYGSQFVEVVGIADPNGSLAITEERACDFGDEFNLDNYEALVKLMNGKFRPMFSE